MPSFIARARESLRAGVMRWSTTERRHAVVLLFAVLGYGAHYLVWCWPQPWYIEDSAISFAYARNWFSGEGLVPFPGAERVEGYSNPLWTFLLGFAWLLRVDPWVSSKLFGFFFGAATLVVVWGLGRRLTPDPGDHSAILPPMLLAFSTQFVVWNASGLENSLFNLLLATGTWRLVVEIQDGHRAPWSALALFGLAITRPDGVMYGLLGLLARTIGTLRNRQWAAWPLWVLVFAGPLGLYHLVRFEYFAWEYPNTYYAKERVFRPFAFTQYGWKQLKDWLVTYWLAWTLPLVLLAVSGWSRARKWILLATLVLLTVFLTWDGLKGVPGALEPWWTDNVGRRWQEWTVWYILAGSVVLGLVSLVGPGWEGRSLLWASLCSGAFFWVYSGNDWMKGYRWGSLLSVPLFTLLGLGIGQLSRLLPFATRRLGPVPVAGLFALVGVGVVAGPHVKGSIDLGVNPETSPNSVHRRVNYMKAVQKRLHLDDVTLMDVDMGAHMWWAPDWRIVDMAGLIDVPMAHHRSYPKAFIDQYVFDEERPDFAHVHGSWARTTRIPQNPRWKKEYFEIPGYPSGGRSLHVGNHVRRDHLVGERYQGPEGRAVRFEGGVTLEGWDIPSPEVAAGGKLFVDTTWRQEGRREGFRVLVFLADAQGGLHSAEVMPGYDWFRPDKWKPEDHVYGRWSIPLPESLPPGSWEVGIVVLDQATGGVLQALPAVSALENGEPPVAPEGSSPARFMVGEQLLGARVSVGTVDQAVAAAEVDLAAALQEAGAGDCEGGAEAWRRARLHVPRHVVWQAQNRPVWVDAMIRCYVQRASGEPDPIERAAGLVPAMRLDHRHPELLQLTRPLGAELEGLGDLALSEERWPQAYAAYRASLQVAPERAHARRKAEEARNLQLGLDEDGKEPPRRPTSAPSTARP